MYGVTEQSKNMKLEICSHNTPAMGIRRRFSTIGGHSVQQCLFPGSRVPTFLSDLMGSWHHDIKYGYKLRGKHNLFNLRTKFLDCTECIQKKASK